MGGLDGQALEKYLRRDQESQFFGGYVETFPNYQPILSDTDQTNMLRVSVKVSRLSSKNVHT